jgi:hypothetical protein
VLVCLAARTLSLLLPHSYYAHVPAHSDIGQPSLALPCLALLCFASSCGVMMPSSSHSLAINGGPAVIILRFADRDHHSTKESAQASNVAKLLPYGCCCVLLLFTRAVVATWLRWQCWSRTCCTPRRLYPRGRLSLDLQATQDKRPAKATAKEKPLVCTERTSQAAAAVVEGHHAGVVLTMPSFRFALLHFTHARPFVPTAHIVTTHTHTHTLDESL